MHLLPRGAGSGGDVFWSEFLVESSLESSNFLRGVFAHSTLGLFEGIRCNGTCSVGHRDASWDTAMLVANTGRDAISGPIHGVGTADLGE